jgi:hypothetical protein
MSCPNTIQKIDRTLIPFKNSRFSFSVVLGTVTIFIKLSAKEKDLMILTGKVYLYVIFDTKEPAIPKITIIEIRAITQ